MNHSNVDNEMKKIIEDSKPKRKVLQNTLKAFLSGGLICVFAQAILLIIISFEVEEQLAKTITIIIMVFLGALATGFGIYDKLGQFSGAGTIVPITGFANSMTSAALESRSEGLFFGILTNVFKLAGSVIVSGVVSSFVIGTIRYLLGI